MHRHAGQFLLVAIVMVLCAAGPSLSEPRVVPEPRAAGKSRTVPRPPTAPAPAAAPGPRVVAEPPVTPSPRPIPGPAHAPGPRGMAGSAPTEPLAIAPAMCGDRAEVSYVVPVGLAPVTNQNTCRGSSRECCERTMEWCVGEGFYWQGCDDCYCGFRCMAPALFFD